MPIRSPSAVVCRRADPQEGREINCVAAPRPPVESRPAAECSPIDREWIAVPSPLLCPESAGTLRAADVVLLAVPAGATVGKRLEAVLEYLTAQDCKVDLDSTWNADETLIRSYYFLPMIGSDTADNDYEYEIQKWNIQRLPRQKESRHEE